MELHPAFQASSPFYLLPPYSYYVRRNTTSLPHNYVHWAETPESHLYSAELPVSQMSTSHDCHGPVDPSVLVLQKDHRSSSILENEPLTDIKCVEHATQFNTWNVLDERM